MTRDETETEIVWYYTNEHGEAAGPFREEELKSLFANKTITGDTLVCRAGEDQWQPYGIASLPPVPIYLPTLPSTSTKRVSSANNVQEYRRTCKACGKVWHSLLEREKKILKDSECNACISGTQCCSPSAAAQYDRNSSAQESEISRLRKCPECQSVNYNEEILSYNIPSTP